MARWRVVAGIAVIGALLGFCVLLVNPYLDNWRLQRYIETVALDTNRATQPEAVFAADVADHAARLGLPVSFDQVRVMKNDKRVYIEVRYFVRVDLMFYTVDLHFRPSAGTR